MNNRTNGYSLVDPAFIQAVKEHIASQMASLRGEMSGLSDPTSLIGNAGASELKTQLGMAQAQIDNLRAEIRTGLPGSTQRVTIPNPQVIELPAPVINVASPSIHVSPTPIHVEPAPAIITNEVHPSPVTVSIDLGKLETILQGFVQLTGKVLDKMVQVIEQRQHMPDRPLVSFRLEEDEYGVKRAVPDIG